ncbi:MAG TPA: beta-galactosidase, partial [Solirubrobacterales bacterium]|nr:beta-galactosidase [Solirubrobacterales bacterium]
MRRTTLISLLLIALLLLAPSAAQALPRGFFGIAPQTTLDRRDTARMRAGGVETIRAMLSWKVIQPSAQGGYDWSSFDRTVALAAEQRLEVLPFLIQTPRWLAGDWRTLPVDSARQRRAWEAFVAAAVARYGRNGSFWADHPLPRVPIRAWQIWNEENFFYFTRPASPTRYARLLAIARRAANQADPRAEIVLGGLFGDP